MRQSKGLNNDLILGWVSRLSKHFGTELSEDQIEIFLHALKDNTKGQINTAFGRCLNECTFMPKLAEVHQRMPDAEHGQEFVKRKTQEMIENLKQFVPNPETWETEERPGVFYQWYGDPKGRFFLMSIRREAWA